MKTIARGAFILLNLIGYWGLLPWLLVVAGKKLDGALRFPSLPVALGLGLGSLCVAIGALGAVWIVVALYLRGGGFPIALLPPSRLVREGPYELSRHPLYVAFTIYLLGWGAIAVSVGTIGIVLPGFVLFWTLYALVHEERVLARRFGEDFSNYKGETPFFLQFRRIQSGPRIVFSLTYLFGKAISRLVFPMQVEGREHLPQTGSAVIVANHACYLDPIFLVTASNRAIRFLTTSEMMRTKGGRWLFSRFGCIPIRRYASDPGAVRKLLACLREGEIVGIFPEGERSWDGNPLPISQTVKKLLARLKVPIVPARIEGSYGILPRWAKIPLPGRITVRFFPPRLPPFSKEGVTEILGLIAVQSDGQTWFSHSTTGIERLLWACPSCHTIGSITARGRSIRCQSCEACWKIDRRLVLQGRSGRKVRVAELAASLSDILADKESLASIGRVTLLEGKDRLQPISLGQAGYKAQMLHVGKMSVPLKGVRSLTIEGNNRLDIGLGKGRRLRLRFEGDSPLKWQRFLGKEWDSLLF
jgi:1-acyl-sn-glycerol-3-phosphate acyltransferase